jgi:hypothetical protein
MTADEQTAALGRLMTRFAEAKQHRAALMAEGRAIGQQLSAIGAALTGLDFVQAFWTGRADGFARQKADVTIATPYPDVATVMALLDDLRTVSAEIRTLRALLKDAGADLE